MPASCVEKVLHVFYHRGLPWGVQTALERIDLLHTMQRRHRRHHDTARRGGGRCNYGIVSPLFDVLFSTYDNTSVGM